MPNRQRKSREEKKLAKIMKIENQGDYAYTPNSNKAMNQSGTWQANLSGSFRNAAKNTDARARGMNKTTYSY